MRLGRDRLPAQSRPGRCHTYIVDEEVYGIVIGWQPGEHARTALSSRLAQALRRTVTNGASGAGAARARTWLSPGLFQVRDCVLVVMMPLADTFLIRLLRLSAMKMFAGASTATAEGHHNDPEVAGPPSPNKSPLG